jgi:dienelactone hydrolase
MPVNRLTKFVCAALVATVLIAGASVAHAAIKTETVIYKEGPVEAHSFLAYNDSLTGKRPGVLVVPEWWGLNSYAKGRAKMLAKLGYVALAADIYGGGRSTVSPKQAAQWSGKLKAGDRHELRVRIEAALAKLKREPMVDPSRTAAIGYCFGGETVLELARSGADVNGVVSFHGELDTHDPAKPGKVKAKILVCTGADDPFVPPAKVEAFENEMRHAKANWQVNVYSGAEHSFTNPAADSFHIKGVAYNAEADRRSWQAMRDFLDEIFKTR